MSFGVIAQRVFNTQISAHSKNVRELLEM